MMSHAVRLSDGRMLSYLEYGDPAGKPVFLLHGAPGASVGWAFIDEPARTAGLRAIAVDRPGIGLSSWQPRRTLLDWPADLAALADALGIDSFALLGWSAGGPYSLACARALPARVTVAGVIAGSLPLDWPGALEGLNPLEVKIVRMSRVPVLVHATMAAVHYASIHWPDRVAKWFDESFSDADRRTAERHPEVLSDMESFTESYRQGARGVARDYIVYGRPWGFDPAEVRVPVEIWHGDDDGFIPLSHGERFAERIPGARLHVLAGSGHLAPLDVGEELLRQLADADARGRAAQPHASAS